MRFFSWMSTSAEPKLTKHEHTKSDTKRTEKTDNDTLYQRVPSEETPGDIKQSDAIILRNTEIQIELESQRKEEGLLEAAVLRSKLWLERVQEIKRIETERWNEREKQIDELLAKARDWCERLKVFKIGNSKSHIPTEMTNDNGVSSNIEEQMKEGRYADLDWHSN
jgi:hypothetical protein